MRKQEKIMKKVSMALLVAASFAALCSGAAFSQEAARDGAFKGTLVCVAFPWQTNVVRVPMDLTVREEAITFARPILGSNQIAGTEIAKGPVDVDGNFSLTSDGSEDGTRYEGKYKGTITGDGGTFTGTQTWSRGDVTRTRICTGAFVRSRV
jgi:hypothetical protein